MKILFTFILLTVAVASFGQTNNGQIDCDTTKYQKLISNSYQYKWSFFQLTDTIEGVIIKHERQLTGCGSLATASLTIIKTLTDTIRVLDLCNQDDYRIGQNIKIIPVSEPKFQVHIPCYILTDGIKKSDKKKKVKADENYIWHSNGFDERILKTTWGQIINE